MAKPAWVLEEQLKARHKRVKDMARLFRPITGLGRTFQPLAEDPSWVTVADLAALLLDMSDADWDRLVGLRRIEASIRRNARHRIKPPAAVPSKRKPGEMRGMRKPDQTFADVAAAREAFHHQRLAELRATGALLVVQADGRTLEPSGAAEPPEPLSEPGDGA